MYASDFKLPKLVVKRLSVNGTKSRLTPSLLQLPPIGKSYSFVEQLPQIEAKAIPFHGRMSDCNVSQLFVANDVTADKPSQFVRTAPRMSSRIKSCKPFMRTPTGSICSDPYGQFGLVCEGKSSLLNSSKSGVVSRTKQPSQYIEDHSDDEWIVDDNRLSLSPDSDCVYSPVPLLNLPTNINDFSANNEHCSIVNLNILLPDPKPTHCNRKKGERFGRPIKTNHQLKKDKAETITKKTSIINELKFDFTDDFTSSSNTNPFNGKHSNIPKENSTEKTTTATRQSSPRKSQPIPIKIINEVDVIQFSNRKILRDPLILTPRRKTRGPLSGKIPVSKGVLGGKNKLELDSSIDRSTATIQFPPVEAFSKKVNERTKTGRFRKRPENGTDDDSHWKQIPPPPTPSHISSMLQITSRMSRQQNIDNNCETFEAANCFKLQPPTPYNSAAAPSPMVDGNKKTKRSVHKYRKPSTEGRCYNKSFASGNEVHVSAEKFITISSVKIHKAVVNEESPREPLFVKKPQVSYKTNEEFSYSDVSASEDDALIKQKVVKLKGQEHGTIRKEKRNDSRVFNNKRPKTTKRSRVPQ